MFPLREIVLLRHPCNSPSPRLLDFPSHPTRSFSPLVSVNHGVRSTSRGLLGFSSVSSVVNLRTDVSCVVTMELVHSTLKEANYTGGGKVRIFSVLHFLLTLLLVQEGLVTPSPCRRNLTYSTTVQGLYTLSHPYFS